MMNSFWVALLSSVLVGAFANPRCEDSDLQECGLVMNGTETFPTDLETLKEVCSEEERKMGCMAEYVGRCPDKVSKGLKDFTEAALKLISSVCFGELQSKYLNNAKCLGDIITTKQTECADKFHEHQHDVCLFQKSVAACLSAHLLHKCGVEAVELYLQIYRVNKLLHEQCN